MPSLNTANTYYVAEAYNVKQYNAGVVRNDNERIFEEEGFTALRFRYTKAGSLPVKLSRLISIIQLAFSIKKNSLVVFHFPLLANAYKWLLQMLRLRGVNTVALIIDIDGLRDKDDMLLKTEIKLLKQFTCIICHNTAMKNKLLEYLPAAKISTIQLFDYPAATPPIPRQLSNSISFAGNLNKAKFACNLQQLKGLQFNVYGLGYDARLHSKEGSTYKGVVAPDLLPAVLEGSFGLVWDGDSIETCDDYLRYNTPHKLSLYVVAGLPVIVWKDSAAAHLVGENNIGFTVSSLTEIREKINSLTAAEYETMRTQVVTIGKQIGNGYFLRKIMDEIKAL